MQRKSLALWIVILVVLSAVLLALPSCATVGIEKAKYEVMEEEGKCEVRLYQSQIIAETCVQADFEEAGNVAFNRLFRYISGANRNSESIKMTAPVSQKSGSEKIEMTAPVSQRQSNGDYCIGFLMPSTYTMETLPVPLDGEVKLREIPVRKMAAIRYSGSWSKERYDTQKSLLMDFIKRRGLTPIGEDIFARYDPPFQLWFLRRNEVLVPIK